MRLPSILCVATLAFGLLAAASAAEPPGFWTTPTVPGYGKMHYLPKAAYKPLPNATYKVVFALTHAGAKPDQVSPSLDHVARTVNLYVASGVPLSHLQFVAVAYGAATSLALDNTHYRAQYGVDNPNLKLVGLLRKDGVDIAVCGQAVAEHDFEYGWISPQVTVALSGLTTVTVLEQRGYTLMPL